MFNKEKIEMLEAKVESLQLRLAQHNKWWDALCRHLNVTVRVHPAQPEILSFHSRSTSNTKKK